MAVETTHLRVPAELRDLLRALARADGRTMQGFLRWLLCRYAAEQRIDVAALLEGRE